MRAIACINVQMNSAVLKITVGLILVFSSFLSMSGVAANAQSQSSQKTEAYQWQSVPIGGGGYVTGLVYHPKEKNLLYSRTDVGGAYRWDNAGGAWIPLNDDIGREHGDDRGVLALALDPNDVNKVYLLAGLYYQDWAQPGAVLISDNQGDTWERVALPFKVGGNENGRGTGERIAVDPNNSQRILIGSNRDGLWESLDGGLSWKKVEQFKPQNILFVMFGEGSDLFVSVEDLEQPLYQSKNNGKTFSPIWDQSTKILFRRGDLVEGNLYVAGGNAIGPNGIGEGGVYQFNLKTKQWRDLAPPAGQGGFSGISVDPKNPARIVVSTMNRWYPKNEIYLTEDAGKHWSPLIEGATWDYEKSPYVEDHTAHWITDIKFDPFNSRAAMFVTGYGVYSTENLNATKPVNWVFEGLGMEETVILELISPPEGAPLLSAMGDIDGFRHVDVTKSPKAGRLKPEKGSNNSIAFAAKKPKLMARTIERGKEVHGAFSKDGGISWKIFKSEPKDAHAGQIALTANGKSLIWTPQGKPMYFSKDKGDSWSASEGIPKDLKPITDFEKNSWVYAYDPENGQVYFSKNSAKSFVQRNTTLPKLFHWQRSQGNLRAVPGFKGHFYVTTGKQLYRSKDAGKTIVPLTSVEESYLVGYGMANPKVKKKNAYPAIYLWGKVNSVTGYFRSDDEGETWIRVNDDQHQFSTPRCITGDPNVFGRVYLGTSGRGIMMGNISE